MLSPAHGASNCRACRRLRAGTAFKVSALQAEVVMLLRHEPDRTIAITQPRHAWLAGDLAQAWGGADFFVPEPRDDLIRPPKTFDKIEAVVHAKLWQTGVDLAGIYGPLPALHVSTRRSDLRPNF